MKTDVWPELYRLVKQLCEELPAGSRRMPDSLIVLTLLWAAINDKPISWATQRKNWPLWCRRIFKRIPSSTTMSRRLKNLTVLVFLAAVVQKAQAELPLTMYRIIDGKPLPIGGASGDRQARSGWSVRGMARGYKLHLVLDLSGRILQWRVAPMNKPEQEMARRLLRDMEGEGYCLADTNYNSNKLFRQARRNGVQLVAPRRKRGSGGVGRRRHDPARLRSINMTEAPSNFGREMLHQRKAIERVLGNLTSFGGGLGPLPAWVRTHRRVHRWVAAKLAIYSTRAMIRRLDKTA